jgi:nucleoside 2-deoxyribosyltransferase
MKIYTASSWRNPIYPKVVNLLKSLGHDVYDFRQEISTEGKQVAFNWHQVDPDWENWDTRTFLNMISHNDLAINAFNADHNGMVESDVCLLITPSGNSSHIEAGYMKGLGKPLYIFMSEPTQRPDLTYKLADKIFISLDDVWTFFNLIKEVGHTSKRIS